MDNLNPSNSYNIMSDIELWSPTHLACLKTAVKVHFSSITSRGIIYEDRNILEFLSEIEREKFEKAIRIISTDGNFPNNFCGFLNILRKTHIEGKIIALIPCDFSHFILFTTSNHYGIMVSPVANNKSVLLSIYCENQFNSIKYPHTCFWKYIVNKNAIREQNPQFDLFLSESIKTITYPNNQIALYSSYDEEEASILRRVDGNPQIKIEFDCSKFISNNYLIGNIELFIATESFSSAEHVYSRLATIIGNYNFSISSLSFINITIFYYPSGDKKILSSVYYDEGEKSIISFWEDGAYWKLCKNGNWSYNKNDSLIITHEEKVYSISTKTSFETYDDLSSHYSNGTEISNNFVMFNAVTEIIERVRNEYLPKHFPKEFSKPEGKNSDN